MELVRIEMQIKIEVDLFCRMFVRRVTSEIGLGCGFNKSSKLVAILQAWQKMVFFPHPSNSQSQ